MGKRDNPMPNTKLTRRQTERHRLGIKTGQIITRLQKCINGEQDMTGQQVAAAKVLLDKIMPNLTAQDLRVLSDMEPTATRADLEALRQKVEDMLAFEECIIEVIGKEEFERLLARWKDKREVGPVKLLSSA